MSDKEAEMLTDYSYSTVVEDKDITGLRALRSMNYSSMLDPEHPVIAAKFKECLARMYNLAPEVVRY